MIIKILSKLGEDLNDRTLIYFAGAGTEAGAAVNSRVKLLSFADTFVYIQQ